MLSQNKQKRGIWLVVHAFNPTTQKQRQVELLSSKPGRAPGQHSKMRCCFKKGEEGGWGFNQFLLAWDGRRQKPKAETQTGLRI